MLLSLLRPFCPSTFSLLVIMRTLLALALVASVAVVSARPNHVKKMPGHTRETAVISPQPFEYMDLDALPTAIDCTYCAVPTYWHESATPCSRSHVSPVIMCCA